MGSSVRNPGLQQREDPRASSTRQQGSPQMCTPSLLDLDSPWTPSLHSGRPCLKYFLRGQSWGRADPNPQHTLCCGQTWRRGSMTGLRQGCAQAEVTYGSWWSCFCCS